MEKIYPEKICEKTMENCSSFCKCSINICPLDLNQHLRTNPERKTCRWMKEAKNIALKGKNQGVQFMSGGKVMPDKLLKLVPEKNAKKLNQASYKRWLEVHKK